MWCMGVVLAMVVVAATALHPQVTEQEESEQYFEESGRAIELKTVWDFRYVRTDATASWLERALGKARYGGEGSERRSLFRVPQASFVVDTRLANKASGLHHFVVVLGYRADEVRQRARRSPGREASRRRRPGRA